MPFRQWFLGAYIPAVLGTLFIAAFDGLYTRFALGIEEHVLSAADLTTAAVLAALWAPVHIAPAYGIAVALNRLLIVLAAQKWRVRAQRPFPAVPAWVALPCSLVRPLMTGIVAGLAVTLWTRIPPAAGVGAVAGGVAGMLAHLNPPLRSPLWWRWVLTGTALAAVVGTVVHWVYGY